MPVWDVYIEVVEVLTSDCEYEQLSILYRDSIT